MGYVGQAPASKVVTSADIEDDAVNSDQIAAGAIDAAHMSVNSIDSDSYVDDSIDAAHYAAGSVDTTALGADSVTAAKIGDNVLDSEHYAAGSIDNEHLADDAVDSDEIAAGAIDTAHIADNQITLAKMAGLARGKIIYGDSGGNPAALAVGSANEVLTHDGTDVSWAAAGGGGNTRDFVASGAIANGAHVALNPTGHAAAGKVSTVESPLKNPVTFDASSVEFLGSDFDSNSNKVVISYKDSGNSNYGTAVVGTVASGAITFGTPVVFNSGAMYYSDVSFDSDANKVVIVYRDDSDSYQGTAVVGTVSGTSISFGTEQHYETGWAYYMVAAFDSNSNKTVIAWKDNDTSYGNAVVATISGTDISFGTAVVFESANTSNIGICFDSNLNKIVIAYRDNGNSNYGTAIVGTVSGTDISFGSAVVFESATCQSIYPVFDTNSNKVVISYQDGGDSYGGKGIVGTVSGTSISFGTASASYGYGYHGGAVFVPTVPDGSGGSTAFNKVVVTYQEEAATNRGTYVVGTVSGTDITFGSEIVYETGNSAYHRPTFDSNSHLVVVSYEDDDDNDYGKSVVIDPSITPNYLNWIGIADAAISDTATGTINLIGSIDDSQSSLTIGSLYYMQDDATVTTTSATNREVGRAVSATELLITQGSVS